MTTNYTTKETIEDFLDNQFNIEIYNTLTETYFEIFDSTINQKRFVKLFDPLFFLKYLYKSFNILRSNSNNYLSFKKELNELVKGFSPTEKVYFLTKLAELFTLQRNELLKSNNTDIHLELINLIALHSKDSMIEMMETSNELSHIKTLALDEILNMVLVNIDAFDYLRNSLDTYNFDSKEKISLIVYIDTYLKQEFNESANENPNLISFLRKCELEKEKIQKIANLEPSKSKQENKFDAIKIEPNITFSPDYKQWVIEVIKIYVEESQHESLASLINSGKNLNHPIIFLSNGNKLAYAFKELKEDQQNTKCSKKELQVWIQQNFRYRYRKETKEFTQDYLEKIISRNDYICKNPLPILKKQ